MAGCARIGAFCHASISATAGGWRGAGPPEAANPARVYSRPHALYGRPRSIVVSRRRDPTGGRKWRRWGTYLPERQWGTVREDYSADGEAWDYLPFDHAALRAYRWGDDGLLGLCDNRGLVCFCVALWNGADPILKERLFGLSGKEGNHGEDVKELYWYLDATPTCSYARALYKYPQARVPVRGAPRAVARGEQGRPRAGDPRHRRVRRRTRTSTSSSSTPRPTSTTSSSASRSPTAARARRRSSSCPQLWFRNTWSWAPGGAAARDVRARERRATCPSSQTREAHLGPFWLYVEGRRRAPLHGERVERASASGARPTRAPHVKDAFHDAIVRRAQGRREPGHAGDQGRRALHADARAGRERDGAPALRGPGVRRAGRSTITTPSSTGASREADEFYDAITPVRPRRRTSGASSARRSRGCSGASSSTRTTSSAGCAAIPGSPRRRASAGRGATTTWRHLYNSEVLSMPDKWEYPWYAAWDLAFHCIPLALVDPEFAKQQLTLLVREWYMHPNGQLPAYEWQFGDVNPPVHAWAAYRVYQIERRTTGRADRAFLESIFLKLMLNFTWWVNRKDTAGRNVFEGGFLGLDNIGVFDRSKPLPGGGTLEQADATSWMGMYCLNMLDIALELARESPSYQDVANKFFEHFLLIAHAINHIAGEDVRLWDERDGFYYDVMRPPVGRELPGPRALDGRPHAALRRGDARARVARALRRVLAARAVVSRRTARSSSSTAR